MIRKYSGEEIIGRAEEALKKSKDSAVYKRAMAVLLTARDGYSPPEASKILGVNIGTLDKYRQEFSDGSYAQPKPPKTGSASYLTWEEEDALMKSLAERAKKGEFVTIRQIKEEYEKVAGCTVGKSAIYRFLERHEWRKVVPRPKHEKTDTQAQEEFKKKRLTPCNR